MSRPTKIALRIFAGIGLAAALIGAKGYDAIHRYDMNNPPVIVQHVAKGETASAEDAKWRLVSLAPLKNPPKDTQPERMWMEIDVEVTALNKQGGKYSSSVPGFDLTDGSGRTWRGELLKGPADQLTPGVPVTFQVISVVPKAQANQMELVLWPAGRRDVGSALHFDR